MTKIYYIFGTTCVGKSTFMQGVKKIMGDRVGLIEVGKEMRRRYPPERFRGLAAMPDTEDEVFNIYSSMLDAHLVCGDCDIILVDGQPRLDTQVDRIWEYRPDFHREIVWLFSSDEVLKSRLESRFADDESSRDLAIKRITNDKIQLFPVLWHLLMKGVKIRPILHYNGWDYNRFCNDFI